MEFARAFTLYSLIGLGVWASLATWIALAYRTAHGPPILPYQRRRRVPWTGLHVLAIAVLYVLVLIVLTTGARMWFDLDHAPGSTADAKLVETLHPIGQLMREAPSGLVLTLCALAAVVVAPLFEEFFFRLVLQGFLEAAERRTRRWLPELRSISPGVLPVAVVAMAFAAIHIRDTDKGSLDQLVAALLVTMIVSLVVLAVGTVLLRFWAGATLADLGIVPGRILEDVRIGLIAYMAVTPPVYFIMIVCKLAFPPDTVADPIPLLVFAVALGLLYYRTHRILPSVVLHTAFNATTIVLLLLTLP
jgi:membrane protease YdiL (CAAX protease family)